MESDLSSEFWKDLTEKNGVFLQIGVRASGKSLFVASLVKSLLDRGSFDEYHLIIPTMAYQRAGTFDYLYNEKESDLVTIYEQFSIPIISNLITKARKDKLKRFIYVDDATAFVTVFHDTEEFRQLTSLSRHLRISSLLCFHHVKGVLRPLVRCSSSYFILHRLVDQVLLTTIWEENMSLFIDKKAFLELCREEMKKDYPCIVLHRDLGKLDRGGMDFSYIRKARDLILNRQKKDIKTKNDDTPKVHKSDGKTREPVSAVQSGVLQSPIQKGTGIKVPLSQSVRRRLYPHFKN
jgi:hypothetical protein